MAKSWGVNNLRITVLSEKDYTVIATWKFNTGSTTDHFDVWWEYYSIYGKWIIFSKKNVAADWFVGNEFQDVITAPNQSDAELLRCYVRPIATKNKNGNYNWASYGIYSNQIGSPRLKDILKAPDPPSVSAELVDGYPRLTLSHTENYEDQYIITRSTNGDPYVRVGLVNGKETKWDDLDVRDGNSYRYVVYVRETLRLYQSAGSEVAGPVDMCPKNPESLTAIAASPQSVRLDWVQVGHTGDTYEVQWSDDPMAWENNDQNAISRATFEATGLSDRYTVSGLETSKRWYFRLRLYNDAGEAYAIPQGWNEDDDTTIVSVLLGTRPEAPTVYTSATTVLTGASVVLSWIHNSEDGSEQSEWEVRLYVGSERVTKSGSGVTSTLSIPVSELGATDGTRITWSVRTKGVLDLWSPFSLEQAIDVMAPPTVGISLADSTGTPLGMSGDAYSMESFPLRVSVTASSESRAVIRKWASISATSTYETVGRDGSDVTVFDGDDVWHGEFGNEDTLVISALDVTLARNGRYIVSGGCMTEDGVIVEAEPVTLQVSTPSSEPPQPYANFDFDPDTMQVRIRPWCYDYSDGQGPDDDGGVLTDGVLLHVARVNKDGTLTRIGSDIVNDGSRWVDDPHPNFGVCNYRIMAVDQESGLQSATDGFVETPCDSIVIQWDEHERYYYRTPTYSYVNGEVTVVSDGEGGFITEGRSVVLNHNVAVGESYAPDVAHVQYAGREHPVAYHGTQKGVTGNWTAKVIPGHEDDKIAALRELSKYEGDCYVRDPSGNGFWATVKVSLSRQSIRGSVDVSLDVTRVDHSES